MSLVLAVVLGWCLVSVTLAFGLGPLMRTAATLAERHESGRYAVQHPAA